MAKKLLNILRVLIVEDTPERQKILTELFRDHAWILVNTAARAIRLLKVYEFDVVSLDYNIGGELLGLAVARHIRNERIQTRVIIHSMNPQGRKQMLTVLPEAVELPVASMVKTNKRFKILREELKKGKDFNWSFAVRKKESI